MKSQYIFVFTLTVLFLLSLAFIGCHNKNPLSDTRDTHDDMTDQVKDNDQYKDVTVNIKPKDSLFVNFEKNWPQLISKEARLLRPVKVYPVKVEWKPIVSSDCVFSEGAGAFVPRVSISWMEPEQDLKDESVRYDVSLQYKGFERDMYTTIYPIQNLQRFKMPGNSQFIQNTATVIQTGPSLFPKLVSLNKELLNIQQQGGNIDQRSTLLRAGKLVRHNMVLEDLGAGLSYTLRKCRFNGENWAEEQHLVFTTPVCPQKF